MEEVLRHHIDHPAAWTSAALGGKDALVLPLGAPEIEALDLLLAHTRDLRPQQVTRADFGHPAINRLMADARGILMNGRGALILQGITPERFSEEQFERIYWGLGTHLGDAAVQSVLGDRVGRVETSDDDPRQRGYRSPQELR